MPEKDSLGYLKYSGKMVEGGLFDARKSAQALLGFDSAIRHLLRYQVDELRYAEFELPVRVREGSWEIEIPEIVASILATSFGGAYLAKAAQKMAEKDFADFGFVDVVGAAILGVQWFAKIAKHMGDATIKQFLDVEFTDDNQVIGIKNSEGEILYVPKRFLDMYASCPATLLKEVALLVEDERKMTIGVLDGGEFVEETITRKERIVFTSEQLDEEILFPELEHNMEVILEGELTRGNERTNTMGFLYNDHVLTISPLNDSVVNFKQSLFLKGRVYGLVTREADDGSTDADRPKILFTDIQPIEDESSSQHTIPFDDDGDV